MKKNIAFLFALIISLQPLCFADGKAEVMTVTTGYGYFTKDGKIVSKYVLPIGEHPAPIGYGWEEVATSSALDAIEVYNPPIPPEQRFDLVKFQGDLFVHVSEYSNVNLRLEFAAINTFAQNKDFSGMKQYLQFLVSNAIATEGDYGIISSVLMTQGIDLSKY